MGDSGGKNAAGSGVKLETANMHINRDRFWAGDTGFSYSINCVR